MKSPGDWLYNVNVLDTNVPDTTELYTLKNGWDNTFYVYFIRVFKNYAKWKQAAAKDYILDDSIYTNYPAKANSKRQKAD